ncbi:MAG: hypothetical protein A2Y53_08105 [Chloroflexi bacterium RBG_16_47_49]|nr:MAG: hypothetical protein A2Y53_08105 [Chloroflexi bacterium RBG_16_47_49]
MDHTHQQITFLGEEDIYFLGLLMGVVDGLVHVQVIQLSGFPLLEFLIQRLKHLAPTKIVIGIQQGLLPLISWGLGCSATFFVCHLKLQEVNWAVLQRAARKIREL